MTKLNNQHIMIIAGEASGDAHASHLVKALKQQDPALTFSGLGGRLMKEAGVELYDDMTRLAVIGFIEVIKHYKEIKKIFEDILIKIEEKNPAAVILVDYPGFNLRLAKKLHAKKIKVIYYISPQIWAWKENRVHQIKKYVTRMIVLFPFEIDFYKRFGIDVAFVGHPLMETIQIHTTKKEIQSLYGLSPEKLSIGLMPGSRQKEIERHLPVMIEACSLLKKDFPFLQFLIIKAETIDDNSYKRYTKPLAYSIPVIEGKYYDAINASDVCIVASGTATLETALMGKPMVIIYKTSWLTWLLAKTLVKIPHVGLVNIVAGKRIVPECIQSQATPKNLANELKNIFTDEIKIASIKTELEKLKENLGGIGASQKAAAEILNVLNTD